MSGNVVRVNSNYKIQAVSGGTITFDTGSNAGTTIVSGSLTVLGTLTQLSTTNTNIKDNIIILNYDDPGPGITSNLSATSGIQIDRGSHVDGDAYILFDETLSWLKYNNTNNVSSNVTKYGLFTFKTADGGINGIQTNSIDTGSKSLSLIGKGTGVVTVTGTTDYEKQVLNYSNNYAVRDDDIIPNIKAVVDLVAFQILTNASDNIKRDDTQFIVYDNSIGQVITTFDTNGTPATLVRFNHPGVSNSRLNVYVGSSITVSNSGITHLDGTWTVTTAVSTADFFYLQTSLTVTVSNALNVSSTINVNNVKSNAKIFIDNTLVTEFQKDHTDIYGLRFQDSTISATTSNANLVLDVSGSSSVIVRPPLLMSYQESDPDVNTSGILLYSKTDDNENTGIYFINETTQGELISKSKALAYSILFG